MGLPVLTTWTNFADVVAHTVEGQKLLSANNYTAFENLVEELANSNGYTFCQETLVKTGAEVSEIGSTTNLMTYTEYATEGVTGGIATATEVATVAETEAGVVATTAGASVGAVSVATVVGGVISGLGLGIASYELAPEFWTGVSNAIFGTDIKYEDIDDYSIMTLFKNNKTYIPSNVVTDINTYLQSINAFNTTYQQETDIDNLNINITSPITYSKFSTSNLLMLFNKAYSLKTIDFNVCVDARTCIDLIMNELSTYANIDDFDYVNYGIDVTNSGQTSILFKFGKAIEGNHTFKPNYKYDNLFGSYSYYGIVPVQLQDGYSTVQEIIRYDENKIPYVLCSNVEKGNTSYGGLQSFVGYLTTVNTTQMSVNTSNINTIINIMSGYNGLNKQQNSTYPTNEPLNVIFPNWFQNALTIGGIKSDKSGLQQMQFLPIEMPSFSPKTTDLATPQAQAQLGDVTTPQQQQTLLDALQRLQDSIPNYPYIQNPPSTDIGNTPTPPTVLISGAANGLMSIHNPTLSELNSLGAYLWSSDIIDQILKLFQNPMDAIIGLHILYGTPSVSGRDIIKAGYLSTGVESNIVDNQYITIDCGTIQVPENSGNATDYPPFTRTSLYLPFIGIVELNAYDIIGSSVNIEYKIDVLTGSCLANVTINKNSSNAILYTYNGNCAVQLPLTGGNYASMISGLIGIGLGAMTGGVGMAVAGVMGAVSQGATVQHSGSIGSNSGAMGIKKPYLIVTRFIPFDAVNYNNYYGYPSNITCKISELSGFTKVKDIRLHSISATNKEKTELEMILKNGVIFKLVN